MAWGDAADLDRRSLERRSDGLAFVRVRIPAVRVSAECRVQGSGFRVQGSGFMVQDSGFRVQFTAVQRLALSV